MSAKFGNPNLFATIARFAIIGFAALMAGAELFGIAGALFASPIAGVLQALLIALRSCIYRS